MTADFRADSVDGCGEPWNNAWRQGGLPDVTKGWGVHFIQQTGASGKFIDSNAKARC